MNAFDTGLGSASSARSGPYARVGVVGAGAWGTALAVIAARAGRAVTLWGRDEAAIAEMIETRENARYLPGITLPAEINPTADLKELARDSDAVLIVTPSETIREITRALAPLLPDGVPVVLCAKGIEAGSGLLMSGVAAEELPGRPIGALSGPTFADEAAAGHLTAVTIASDFPAGMPAAETPAARMALSLGTANFRPYISDDLVGVEVGGAVKNVVAIACGIAAGAGFAANTRAALITRGLDEMKRLAEAIGGRRETVTGLAGVGDLTLTCSSTHSRNLSLGMQLGQGRPRAECFDGRPVVVEGEANAISVTDLARMKSVHMPIAEAVRAILHEGAPIGQTFARLWTRPIEAEPRALQLALDHPAPESQVRDLAGRMP
ncbi:NAD(P)-dependent glycerol-3-phosphate dehydrogenase [Limibaculum sp. M0105]|uniref:Glycerol-3-phosphate dehydrogenase [NAD(P)+] n=1 Tax=Thermohalobaculum xanthum TaxID=2753746 RepID=A0A8J7M626_9RHOB|nr:NAD(P)H-dependent glycerol-3-phosphate dehydrogenase [Thermohalobaculum xanthum]MBK0399206.1 NAD(P)-dependent glycerol-3-phosphate dehydrogenase [Thermohalobaculum xanthum]